MRHKVIPTLNFFFRNYVFFKSFVVLGCPGGWVYSNNRCYKFVDDNPSIFEEADAACWVSTSHITVNRYTFKGNNSAVLNLSPFYAGNRTKENNCNK